jgi:hypothetical protein
MSIFNLDEVLSALAQDRVERGGICTTTLNVIAFVEHDDELLRWMAESSDAFAEAHRFRILLLDGSRGPQSRLVRTHCKELGDTVLTSLEQIQVGVEGIPAAELRSIAHDLLVPNVRNVLLWAGSRLLDERFSALSSLADRVVLFSASGASALASLRELTQMLEAPLASRVCDLAYMRLLAWQDLTAQFFDESDLAAELPNISRVSVISGSEPEAYYLAAWLAGRLGWDPCGDLKFCDTAGRAIHVDFRKEGRPRRIRGIELEAAGCTFGIKISPDAEDLICLTVHGRKKRPVRCVPLHDVDIISLVERAIFSPEDGGVYLQTLGVLKRLLEYSA